MKIFVAGNPLLKEDSLPVRLLPRLKRRFPDVAFSEFDPTGNLKVLGRNPVIIDTVDGIEDFMVIEDLDQIREHKMYSLHDFDLGTNLKLMKKMEMIDSVKIIGIPMEADEEEALEYIAAKIKEIMGNL